MKKQNRFLVILTIVNVIVFIWYALFLIIFRNDIQDVENQVQNQVREESGMEKSEQVVMKENTQSIEHVISLLFRWFDQENIFKGQYSLEEVDAYFQKNESKYEWLQLPVKNIYCWTSEEQYQFQYKVLSLYTDNLEESIESTNLFSQYTPFILAYLRDEKSDIENPINVMWAYMLKNNDVLLKLFKNGSYLKIREKLYSIDPDANIEIMFLLFAYKNNIALVDAKEFLDACYLYDLPTRQYNTQYLNESVLEVISQ